MHLENFVPIHTIQHSPDTFGSLMQQRYGIPTGTEERNMTVGDGRRPDRDYMQNGHLALWSDQFRGLGYYNVLRDEHGKPNGQHINLSKDPKSREAVQKILKDLASRNLIRVITPFVDEDSAVLAASYNASLIGDNNVVAVEASVNQPNREKAITQVEEAGIKVQHQKDILDGINWKLVREQFKIFPTQEQNESDEAFAMRLETEMNQPPKGSKGETMFAGMLTLYAKDKIARMQQNQGLNYDMHDILDDDTWIVFHDTDIINPEEYAATEYLAFAMQYQPGNTNFDMHYCSAQISRHGPGRNNHPMMLAASLIADNTFINNEKVRLMGLTLESLSWPITGERAFRWGELKKMLWTNGMGIETWINMWNASRDVQEQTRGLAQVANPSPKREEAISDAKREISMINGLALWMLKTAKFAADIDKLPTEWTQEDVARYNDRLGGQVFYISTMDEFGDTDGHNPMVDSEKKNEYIFPSMDQLFEVGALNVYAIAGVEDAETSF